jgi:hypothetical protein
MSSGSRFLPDKERTPPLSPVGRAPPASRASEARAGTRPGATSGVPRVPRSACYAEGVQATSPPHLPGSYLVLELTNLCSLACVHCSVSEAGHAHHSESGYLDVGLAESLFEELAELGARFDSLVLFWLGEPLIHPHFLRIWQSAVRAAARSEVFGKIEVHTNATHLTQAMTRSVLNEAAVPQVWHFSLDAIEQDSYARIKGMDRFEQVQQHVAGFIAERARLRAAWPRPVMQFIVGENNVAQVGAFRAHWAAVCEQAGTPALAAAGHVPPGADPVIFFRQLDCPTPEAQARTNALFVQAMAEQGLALPEQAEAGREVKAENLSACSGFWKSPVVSWRGEVTSCTRDNLLSNSLGRLTEHSFSELWWGGQQQDRRRQVAQGNYDGLSICSTCFIPRSLNHSQVSPADIEAQSAWDCSA